MFKSIQSSSGFKKSVLATAVLGTLVLGNLVHASSHREGPAITTTPKVDATDFYMFRSYETGRENYVTLIANYIPLQDPYGGPNYFNMDPNALYEIHVDNNGDAKEDLTFQFRFANKLLNGSGATLPINGTAVAIPLVQFGTGVSNVNDARLNVAETYGVTIVRNGRRAGAASPVSKTGAGSTFEKPVDYIGEKTLGNSAAYESYAQKHIHSITIPGCAADVAQAKVFVGQRQEGFAVNLGPIFDLVNAPAAVITNRDQFKNAAAVNSIQDKNVTTIALEVHKDCLATSADPVIGGWTTASLRQSRIMNGKPPAGLQTNEKTGGAWVQVSRLGQPLVNEVVIGLKDKDAFNASKPESDTQFLSYVATPTLPALIDIGLNGARTSGIEPTNFPRTDLLTVFLTGITGVNKPRTVTPAEMLRLNTSVAPKPYPAQSELGVLGGDTSGFPNGRRPKDDVVDVALQAVLGALCVANGNGNALGLNTVPGTTITSECNPSKVPLGATSLKIHDGVDQAAVPFLSRFPYLNTPLPGAQN